MGPPSGWTVTAAVASTHKYAVSDGGDTAEVVERPGGGLGIVLADGQGSGAAAKHLSLLAAGRAIALLRDGVRGEAAAIAASDALLAQRGGRVSVALDVVTIEPDAREISVTRFSPVSGFLQDDAGAWSVLPAAEEPAGRYARQTPVCLCRPLASVRRCVLTTDGVGGAGERIGHRFGLLSWLRAAAGDHPAQDLADALLAEALRHDQGRARDDMTALVIEIAPAAADPRLRRWMSQATLR